MTRALPLLAAALALSGCLSGELARVRYDVERDLTGARLAGYRSHSFGPLTLGLARSVVGGDEPEVADALRHVRGVAFGRYAVRGSVALDRLDLSRTLASAARRRWAPVVVARDDSSAAFVLARERDGALADLLVVAFYPGQLTLARVHGRLDQAALALLAGGGGLPGPVRDVLGVRSVPGDSLDGGVEAGPR